MANADKRGDMKIIAQLLLLALAVSSKSVLAAADPVSIQVGPVAVTYLPNQLWFSNFLVQPKFTNVVAEHDSPYGQILDGYLKKAGYSVGEAKGINLSVIEEFAGDTAEYQQRKPEDRPKLNGLEVAAAVGFYAILQKAGLYSPSSVGMTGAANNVLSTSDLAKQALKLEPESASAMAGKMAQAKAGNRIVLIHVCSAGGKKCASSAAVTQDPAMTLDQLREASMREGMARALGLATAARQ